MAQLRPIYKTTGVRGHFSVGSLLPPVSSSRKIRLFLFKNILSPFWKNCWQVRKTAECFLIFKKSLCSYIEQRVGRGNILLGNPANNKIMTWVRGCSVLGLGHGEVELLPWRVGASQEQESLTNKKWMIDDKEHRTWALRRLTWWCWNVSQSHLSGPRYSFPQLPGVSTDESS